MVTSFRPEPMVTRFALNWSPALTVVVKFVVPKLALDVLALRVLLDE